MKFEDRITKQQIAIDLEQSKKRLKRIRIESLFVDVLIVLAISYFLIKTFGLI